MNNFTIVNIQMKPVYDKTSLLPLYQINNPIYIETVVQKVNQEKYDDNNRQSFYGENNC